MARSRRTSRQLQDTPSLFDSLSDDLQSLGNEYSRRQSRGNAEEGLELRMPAPSPFERLMFMSFGSGSSGNCAYLGTAEKGILIDAGIDSKVIFDAFERNGISPNAIRGILLTHDHGDHVRYLYSFLRRNHRLPLYCTLRTLNGLFRRHNISRRVRDHHVPIYKEISFSVDDTFRVTAFETSHDGSDNCGFYITFGPADGHSFAVTTDTGYITPRADYYMRRARYIMIESNYDLAMLQGGSYHDFLKARIISEHGHLDNADTADYLTSLVKEGDPGYPSHIFLCHLSQDNNTPEIALRTATDAIINGGATVIDAATFGDPHLPEHTVALAALPRHECSPLFVFRV